MFVAPHVAPDARQSASTTHSTHRFEADSQTGAARVHWAFAMHSTHSVAALHTPAVQALPVAPGVFVHVPPPQESEVHSFPSSQSEFAAHCAQDPAMQVGVAPPH